MPPLAHWMPPPPPFIAGPREKGPGERPPMPPVYAQRTEKPFAVLDVEKKPVLGFIPPDGNIDLQPSIANGKTAGYIGLVSPKHFLLSVIPAQAGIQALRLLLDPRFHGDDELGSRDGFFNSC